MLERARQMAQQIFETNLAQHGTTVSWHKRIAERPTRDTDIATAYGRPDPVADDTVPDWLNTSIFNAAVSAKVWIGKRRWTPPDELAMLLRERGQVDCYCALGTEISQSDILLIDGVPWSVESHNVPSIAAMRELNIRRLTD